jgi:hypothetical protein
MDYSVKEGFREYGYTEFDPDPDPDSDFDKIYPNVATIEFSPSCIPLARIFEPYPPIKLEKNQIN